MRFLEWFRRAPPIADADTLAAFIDSQAAFLMQKGIYEYSRARSGHYAKVMFGEQQFIDAFNLARWQAYPLGLAMVGELVEGVLRGFGGASPKEVSMWVRDLVLSVFDSHPVPPPIGEQAWRQARADLALRLQHVSPRNSGEDLFRPDADPREAARPRLSHHAQLPQGHHVQHPRRADATHGCAGTVAVAGDERTRALGQPLRSA
jgi:hypothetical protein